MGWGLNDIKEARNLLKLRYDDDAPCSDETIQEMIDVLKSDFGDDPEQIARAILQHFGVKKKR